MIYWTNFETYWNTNVVTQENTKMNIAIEQK